MIAATEAVSAVSETSTEPKVREPVTSEAAEPVSEPASEPTAEIAKTIAGRAKMQHQKLCGVASPAEKAEDAELSTKAM